MYIRYMTLVTLKRIRVAQYGSEGGELEKAGIYILDFCRNMTHGKMKSALDNIDYTTEPDAIGYDRKMGCKVLKEIYESTEPIKLIHNENMLGTNFVNYVYDINLGKHLLNIYKDNNIYSAPVLSFKLNNLPTNEEYVRCIHDQMSIV